MSSNLANTARKVSKYRVISGPYFSLFGLNMEGYGVSLRIQPEYRKIRTRNNSVFEHFSHFSRFIKQYSESRFETWAIAVQITASFLTESISLKLIIFSGQVFKNVNNQYHCKCPLVKLTIFS